MFDKNKINLNKNKLIKVQDKFLHDLVAKQIANHLLDFIKDFNLCLEINPTSDINFLLPNNKRTIIKASNNLGQLKKITKLDKSDTTILELYLDYPPCFPHPNNCFDLVIANFAFDTYNRDELTYLFLEINRIMKADGLFVTSYFCENNLPELKLAFAYADSNISNRVYQRVHPGINYQSLGQSLTEANFKLPVIKIEKQQFSYSDIFQIIKDIRQTFGSNCLLNSQKSFTSKRLFNLANDYLFKEFSKNEKILLTINYMVSFARKEHQNQQKPAKRGSANIPFDFINQKTKY